MKWGRTTLIVVGAIIVTALGIDAADTFTGSRGTLLSGLVGSGVGGCPVGMVSVENVPSLTCVDAYEASPAESCAISSPDSVVSSQRNIEQASCVPDSRPDVLPWRFITRDQAMVACARAGKRLPTSEEWYTMTLGIPDPHSVCNINSRSLSKAGAYNSCVSPHGVYDLVGNVWEWVSDDVINGVYDEQILPDSGYVAQVDRKGMATVVSDERQELFGYDYFWSRTDGAYGIIRGGFYDSGTDAGIYTVHADTPPTAASQGIGFRCVK